MRNIFIKGRKLTISKLKFSRLLIFLDETVSFVIDKSMSKRGPAASSYCQPGDDGLFYDTTAVSRFCFET